MSEVQAVLFDRNLFNETSSKTKLKEMNLKPIKPVHLTSKYYRYRLKDPSEFKRFSTRLTKKGITLIIGFKS